MAEAAAPVATTARAAALWAAAVFTLSVGAVSAPLIATLGRHGAVAAIAPLIAAGVVAGALFKQIYPNLSWKNWAVYFLVFEFLALASAAIDFALHLVFAERGLRFGALAPHVMLALAMGVHFARAARVPAPAPVAALALLCVTAWLWLVWLTFFGPLPSRGALALLWAFVCLLSGAVLVKISRGAGAARFSRGMSLAGMIATALILLPGLLVMMIVV